jgi:hypothetical protein
LQPKTTSSNKESQINTGETGLKRRPSTLRQTNFEAEDVKCSPIDNPQPLKKRLSTVQKMTTTSKNESELKPLEELGSAASLQFKQQDSVDSVNNPLQDSLSSLNHGKLARLNSSFNSEVKEKLQKQRQENAFTLSMQADSLRQLRDEMKRKDNTTEFNSSNAFTASMSQNPHGSFTKRDSFMSPSKMSAADKTSLLTKTLDEKDSDFLMSSMEKQIRIRQRWRSSIEAVRRALVIASKMLASEPSAMQLVEASRKAIVDTPNDKYVPQQLNANQQQGIGRTDTQKSKFLF